MSDYRWTDFDQEELVDRFPSEGIAGVGEWRDGASRFPAQTQAEMLQWLDAIQSAPRGNNELTCPCVFVSHRKNDVDQALRIAYEACTRGFDYWLDVIDLEKERTNQVKTLESGLGRSLSTFEIAVLTAAIIEVALLNCSHVLAVMTCNTAGSQWVPYEYGRVKDPKKYGAACWWDHTTLEEKSLPEYLHLAPVLKNQCKIRSWLESQLQGYPSCSSRSSRSWTGSVPDDLPTG